jgi:hypothetical protein
MLKQIKDCICCAAFVIVNMAFQCAGAQSTSNTAGTKLSTEEATAKANAELDKKSEVWVTELKLNDAAKEKRVAAAVAKHLKAVRDWNNEHPFTTVPAGINPATGNKLSELDRQVIANSAIPVAVHESLMSVLKNELSQEQVEAILDKYTIGKVAFTLKGYKAIVPDLTQEEEAKITEQLKQAREQAIDFKNMRQISAIFEIYKTKCEQYLNSNGRNWRQLYKAYTEKVKAQKAEQKKEKTN